MKKNKILVSVFCLFVYVLGFTDNLAKNDNGLLDLDKDLDLSALFSKELDFVQYTLEKSYNNDENIALSGYHALKNGFCVAESINANIDPKEKINSNIVIQELYGSAESQWRNFIINQRLDNLANTFIKHALLEQLKNIQETENTKKYYINSILSEITVELAKSNFIQNNQNSQNNLERVYSIDPEKLLEVFKEKINKKFAKNTTSQKAEELISSLPVFSKIEFTVSENIAKSDKVNYKRELESKTKSILPGDWLTDRELELLAEFEQTRHTAYKLPVICIKDVQKDINNILTAINSVSLFSTVILLINNENRWVSCVVNKTQDKKVNFFLVDLLNSDLNQNKNFVNLLKLIDLSVIEDQQKAKNNKQSKKESKDEEPKNDYRSPYFDVSDEDLPSLEQFFNGRVPNKILNLIDMLKSRKTNNFKTDIKKGLVLYGPPGTGKSTVAEIIARASGRKVLFIDGGSFKTEFQGSGARIVRELFEAAENVQGPVVIVIDEIDGATSKIRQGFSTSEDNQTAKKIISELNKHLLSKNTSIYVICTTNYLENIEGAILNRFSTLEIAAPDYTSRLNVLSHYLKINNIALEDNKPVDISLKKIISYDKSCDVSTAFLLALVTATRNWTGRDLQAIVNNAVSEYSNDKLTPEHDKNIWRFVAYNLYDFKDRKLKSTALLPLAKLVTLANYKREYTRLEKFLYSSYINELQRINKVKDMNKNTLYPSEEPFKKKVKDTIIFTAISTTVTLAATNLWNSLYKVLSNKTNSGNRIAIA